MKTLKVIHFCLLISSLFSSACKSGDFSGLFNPTGTGVSFAGLTNSDVQVSQVDDSITLTWQPATDATGAVTYLIYGDPNFTTILASTTATTWTLTNATPGKTYVFGVRAQDENGTDSNTNFVTSILTLSPPSFAGLVSASTASNTKILLSWAAASSSNLLQYNVYFSDDLQTPITSTESTSVFITNLTPSTNYSFVVRAENTLGEEDANTVIKSAQTLSYTVPDFNGLQSVSQLTGIPALSSLKLSWNPAGGLVTGYTVYQASSSGGENFSTPSAVQGATTSGISQIAYYVPGANTTSVTVNGLSSGTTYYFVVRAFYEDSNNNIYSETNNVELPGTTASSVPPPVGPTLLSVAPSTGPTAGNLQTITITASSSGVPFSLGNYFNVQIGGINCNAQSYVSPTKITCVPSGGATGSYPLVVTNGDGGVATPTLVYNYTSQAAPTVTGVTPTSGAILGSTSITVSGSGFFVNGNVKPTVMIGNTACGNVVLASSGPSNPVSTLTCSTPPGTAGTVDVTVINPDTQTGMGSNLFTYNAAPTITNLSPNVGPFAGSTVTITGTNFYGTPTVKFGANAAASVNLIDSSHLVVKTGSTNYSQTSLVSVTVSNPDGQLFTDPLSFNFQGPPTLTQVVRSDGPKAGNVQVVINGTNFVPGSTTTVIQFGSVNDSAQCTIVSNSQIDCLTPSSSVLGAVPITVTNPDNQFSFPPIYYTYDTPLSVNPLTSPNNLGKALQTNAFTVTGNGFVQGGAGTSTSVYVDGTQIACAVNSLTSMSCETQNNHPVGVVNVQVVNPDNETINLLNGYSFYSALAPTVSGTSPQVGVASGNASVTIHGTNFQPVTTIGNSNYPLVYFGTALCTNVAVVNSTTITCNTPANTGYQNVYVVNPDYQQSNTVTNAYLFSNAPAPTISSLSLPGGPIAGGTTLTITGTNFSTSTAPTVTIGGVSCPLTTSNGANTSTTLHCTTGASPGGTAGVYPVIVTNSDTQSATGPNYSYQSGITLSGTPVPAGGGLNGGNSITLSGTNFLTGMTILFDPTGTPASCVITGSVAPTSVTCTTSAHPSGSVAIKVTNPDGTTATSGASAFTYQGPPAISRVFPAYGGQGTTITLLGSGFLTNPTVTIGSGSSAVACSSVSLLSSYRLTCQVAGTISGTTAQPVSVTNWDTQNDEKPSAFSFSSSGLVNSSGTATTASNVQLQIGNYSNRGEPSASNPSSISAYFAAYDATNDYVYVGDSNHYLYSFNLNNSEPTPTLAAGNGTANTSCSLNSPAVGQTIGLVAHPRFLNGIMYFEDEDVNHDCISSYNPTTQKVTSILSPANQNTAGLSGLPWDGALAATSTNLYYVGGYPTTAISLVNTTTNTLTTVAGGNSGSVDVDNNTGVNAVLTPSSSMCSDGTNLYFIDNTNALRMMNGSSPYGVHTLRSNLPLTGALISDCVIDTTGGYLYAPSSTAHLIYQIQISSPYSVSQIGSSTPGDIDGSSPTFWDPISVTINPATSTLYITDGVLGTVRQMNLSGIPSVSTPWFNKVLGFSADGTNALGALFGNLNSVTTDGYNFYMADYNNFVIREVSTSGGDVTTLAGSAGNPLVIPGGGDGIGTRASFSNPIAAKADRNYLWVLDSQPNYNLYLRSVQLPSPLNLAENAAGVGTVTSLSSTNSATGIPNYLYTASDLVSDSQYIYVAVAGNPNTNYLWGVWKIDPNNPTTPSILAGSYTPGTSSTVDGVGSAATFFGNGPLAMDANYIYYFDNRNCTVRRIVYNSYNSSLTYGQVQTIAGSGCGGSSDSANGLSAKIGKAGAATTDGNYVYFIETTTNKIRSISTAGNYVSQGTVTGFSVVTLFSSPYGQDTDVTNNPGLTSAYVDFSLVGQNYSGIVFGLGKLFFPTGYGVRAMY